MSHCRRQKAPNTDKDRANVNDISSSSNDRNNNIEDND